MIDSVGWKAAQEMFPIIRRAIVLCFLLALCFMNWRPQRLQAARQSDSHHWAFLPPVRPPLPEVKNRAWVRNPIDNFILAELEKSRPHALARSGQSHADSPPEPRPDGAAADARGDRRIPGRPAPGRLREAGRPAARLAALRRALGPPLARRGALRRHQRFREGPARARSGPTATG